MTRAEIEAMLREYRWLIGRCGHIEAEIQQLQRAIRAQKAQFERDLAAPPVSRLTGMPRSAGNGSPTERIALSIVDGSAYAHSEAREAARRMQARIDALQDEREARQLRARYVESWLSGLPERERWVIERHIIEGEIWHDVIPQFNRRFDDDISLDRIKRLQRRALERIFAMAG